MTRSGHPGPPLPVILPVTTLTPVPRTRPGRRPPLRDAAPMHLTQIAALLGVPSPPGEDPEIADLAYDSRTVVPGAAFFCLTGSRDDGHRHAPQAWAAGARAIICERPLDLPVAQLILPSARKAMSRLAAPFFGYPSRQLTLVGVTGTNGKTTTAYLLESIFRAAGRSAGLIGTVQSRVPGFSSDGVRTTPESIDLQRMLARMVRAGVGMCAMEVTSIGLAQGRVDGTEFSTAIFTNLTQDHLDYHGDLEHYYRAKRSLFTTAFLPFSSSVALVNADDPFGVRLHAELTGPDAQPVPCLTFGVSSPADVRVVDLRPAPGGSRFRVVARPGWAPGPAGRAGLDLSIALPLPGSFNVSNALAASAAAALGGCPAEAIEAGLTNLAPIPGRFELVDEGQEFTVAVDYAHTPDGLERVLAAARELAGRPAGDRPGRVLTVFGCGGDRDRGKRPLMGRAAGAGAHQVFVTSDNPRGEDPAAIMAEVESGLRQCPPPGGHVLIADRREAIEAAIEAARPGDVVVIAGKGHETTQTFAGRVIDFDDRLVAAEALRRRAGGPGPAVTRS